MTKTEMGISVSEPKITVTAKDFLADPNNSARYMAAVQETVDRVMSAIMEKTEEKVKQGPTLK
ncbi:hypothetical protein HYS10_00535 [Candidatus Collierbacteria bacterium]|nr:hypothetical protein [Candidatus Collierbacteria bacterium]